MGEFNVRMPRLWGGFVAILWLCCQSAAYAHSVAEQEKYLQIANETLEEVMADGVRDPEGLIQKQEQLIAMGVAFCREYSKIYPEHEKFLLLVADSAKDMAQMTQDEIKRNWYRGELPKQHGIDIHGKDHFEEVNNLMDLVVHPSHVIILLRMYKVNRDKLLLRRIKIELGELINHAETLFNMTHVK